MADKDITTELERLSSALAEVSTEAAENTRHREQSADTHKKVEEMHNALIGDLKEAGIITKFYRCLEEAKVRDDKQNARINDLERTRLWACRAMGAMGLALGALILEALWELIKSGVATN
jgi:hypothetical protein